MVTDDVFIKVKKTVIYKIRIITSTKHGIPNDSEINFPL